MAAHGTTIPPTLSDVASPPPVLVEAALRLEQMQALDPMVERIGHAAAALVQNKQVADLLHGKFMGHALHPLLTDVPIGTWTSAFVLDFIGGKKSRPAATRLIGTGILAAVPTAVTGLAEFAATDDRAARRVGVVHAAGNNVALVLYVLSFRARRRGRHGSGVLLSLAGLGLVGATGFLGAHLSLARKVATRDPAFAEQVPLAEELARGSVGGAVGGASTSPSTSPMPAAGSGRHREDGTDPAAAI